MRWPFLKTQNYGSDHYYHRGPHGVQNGTAGGHQGIITEHRGTIGQEMAQVQGGQGIVGHITGDPAKPSHQRNIALYPDWWRALLRS